MHRHKRLLRSGLRLRVWKYRWQDRMLECGSECRIRDPDYSSDGRGGPQCGCKQQASCTLQAKPEAQHIRGGGHSQYSANSKQRSNDNMKQHGGAPVLP